MKPKKIFLKFGSVSAKCYTYYTNKNIPKNQKSLGIIITQIGFAFARI